MSAGTSPTKILLLSTATLLLLAGCFNAGGDDDGPPVVVTLDGGGTGDDTGMTDPDPDTGVDPDPDGGEDPDPTDQCEGIRLETAGTLDLDIPKVSVNGVVTVGGERLPDGFASRGQIVFTNDDGTTSASVPLGTSGEATFNVAIPPGQYDIRYSASQELCDSMNDPTLPCNSGVIRSDIGLQNDGSLNVDIPTVKVRGAVTVGGEQMPDAATERGRLTFSGEEDVGSHSTDPVGAAGAATYQTTLLPGTYDVMWAGTPGLCAGDDSPGIPCHTGMAREGVNLNNSGTLDVDLSVIEVRGSVTVNGEQMGSANGDRGTISFVGANGAAASSEGFGASGSADYSLSLMPGSYEVMWEGSQALCQTPPAPPVPCNSGKIRQIDLGTSGTLDIDVPRVAVNGAVTVNGESVPAADPTSGTVTFRDGESGGLTAPIDWGSGGTYTVSLLAGTYDIVWAGSPQACQSGDLPMAPCNSGPVKNGIALNNNGSLNVDIPAVTVRGGITAKGGPIPNVSGSPGTLAFVGESAGTATYSDIDEGGTGSYELRLLADTYDVRWLANSSICDSNGDLPSLPCIGGILQSGVGLSNSGTLDVDVPSIQVRGSVTQNGESMPEASADRGSLQFKGIDGGKWSSSPFGTSGTPSYNLTLMPGRYTISHTGNADLCAPTSPSPTVSCATQVLKGCP
jgi:hypothetical protein